MANPTTSPPAVGPSTLITVKVLYNDNTRRFKIPLKELGARTLPQNLRQLLSVPEDANVVFERYSDSASCYVHLDSQNPAVYKQLYRAAKAKLKLRIKVTTVDETAPQPPVEESLPEQQNVSRYSYLETVLSSPLPESQAETEPNTASASTSATNLIDNVVCPIPAETQSMQWGAEPSSQSQFREFAFDSPRFPIMSHASPSGVFCIDCNRCGLSIPNEHYHCSLCDDGDYDLCPQCVDSGATCLNEEHWLIRRSIKDGKVTTSTTETIPPRKVAVEEAKEVPEAPVPEPVRELSPEPAPALAPAPAPASALAAPEITDLRICNDCLKELDENQIVSCADCDDYDLCITCLLKDSHGHHPAHTFALLKDRQFALKSIVQSRCNPGRHHHHAAICDGCEKRIIGVRHKCLTCPDWDYCTECYENVAQRHPGHRFAPLYDSIAEPLINHEVHYGIYCDGPLCRTKSCPTFITGTRYKCSVCHDTDFCASCEVHPTNTHNRTHPLLMLKTPVRDVRVSTFNEAGQGVTTLGDRLQKSISTEATTLGEPEPAVQEAPEPVEQVGAEAKPVEQASPVVNTEPAPVAQTWDVDPASGYQAFFIRDTIPDDTAMAPNTPFQQTWTLFNPGPMAWPAGTDVRFVGGDSMFNVDTNHPLSVDSIATAMESNKMSQSLEPGHSADFTVTLKTPSRPGTAISYWRLKLPNGMPFGHRLWCDIQVREPTPETEAPSLSEDVKASPAVEPSQPEPAGSQMIFPKLDKESPESSTHEAARTAPTAPSVSYRSEQDVLDDMDSLTLDDETDVGLLTDEEYDILDASDQEYLEAKSQH
ncbi:ZZ type zinc finger domain protein [Aspergillus homomorphus CBS 101889]|uniref:ZZ type zinc finger domain protein n=1 Tax=Aspergillus homomorphus (strain CBS 101889) TaxID=1450537 RepID=A0A395HKT6_ASPHC|nr:ZZ type zinc finger domain protein [Aspergillus homomorphus CBS 101889]RAL06884.1 ZZ type zinc finger domain protein [Aspergillus homomorphus CBS 101889]